MAGRADAILPPWGRAAGAVDNGTVHRARDTALGIEVALKVLAGAS